MLKKRYRNTIIDVICFIAGSLLYAVSVNTFTAPNNIAPGGVTGLATLANALVGTPIGVMTVLCNIPLFVWGIRQTGWRMMIKSAVAVVTTSLAIDFTATLLPHYQGDYMLVCIYGGITAGAGLGLIFLRGGTTGGVDLAANLLIHKVRHLSLGKLILLIDLPIVALSAFVYDSMESPLYAIIVIFLTSKVIDTMLYGADAGTGKLLFIMSGQLDQIRDTILFDLSRGTTELRARGSYTKQDRDVLLVAVRRAEIHRTFDMIYAADPDAFIIVADASEITGEGFKRPRLPKK